MSVFGGGSGNWKRWLGLKFILVYKKTMVTTEGNSVNDSRVFG